MVMNVSPLSVNRLLLAAKKEWAFAPGVYSRPLAAIR